MALNPAVLAALIKSKRIAALGDALADDAAGLAALDADCQAIAEACVEHITAAAVVTTTFAPGTIAVTGTAAAQANPAPVVGTGSVG